MVLLGGHDARVRCQFAQQTWQGLRKAQVVGRRKLLCSVLHLDWNIDEEVRSKLASNLEIQDRMVRACCFRGPERSTKYIRAQLVKIPCSLALPDPISSSFSSDRRVFVRKVPRAATRLCCHGLTPPTAKRFKSINVAKTR